MTLIVVPDDFPPYLTGTPAEAKLRTLGDVVIHNRAAPRDADELAQRCADAEVIINIYGRNRFPAPLLARLKRLRLISRSGTGVEGVDLEACRRQGVAVAHLRANDADEIAEHAIALMLCALRRIPEMDRFMRAGAWSGESIRGARGRTLGIVGMGAIGGRTAALGRALGMQVLAWSFGPDEGRAARAGATAVELDDLLRRSDVVSLHLRVSDATRGMFDAGRLGLMKRDAVLVNTARGALVDREALLAALRERRIAAAGLDVYHAEPPVAGDPLLALPNVVMTPHNGSNIAEVVARGLMTTVGNVENFLKGQPTNLAVDPR
ncbi:MAG: D-2-hydroxyacid dehydrogenase family protein [Alphaproteobacteria bacterium]|nr:D-2-hydroxyacid dehydrogenase family protein [Alphaproteobacteria bacterium]